MHRINGIEFNIIKKRGLKNLYIYVRDSGVEVRTPFFVNKKKIFDFVDSKSSWIIKQQQILKNRPIFNDNDIDKKQLRLDAIHLIEPLVEKWSKIMNVQPAFIGYRYNKSRWGSCSSKNRINFNIKLALMPKDFIEYVVVHELAHIKHKNHSKEFWNEIKKYLNDYKSRKKLKYKTLL